MNREAIMQALFALLASAVPWQTTGRRLIMWTQVAAQPAMFLRNVGEAWEPRPTRMPARVELDCEVWIYSNAGLNSTEPPAIALNTLIEAVVGALQPVGADAQTLGGLVTHCWVEGKIEIEPGDIGGQAIAIVPVKILVATLGR